MPVFWRTLLVGGAILIVLVVAVGSVMAQEQQPCFQRDVLLAMIEKQYGEVPVQIGTAGQADANMAELTLSDQGSWTLVITMANGCSRIIAGGRNWQETGNKPGPTGRPS